MALQAPVNLVLTPIDTTRIDFSWQNKDNYQRIQIWLKKEGQSYSQIDWIDGNEEYYEATGLEVNTKYYGKVKGEKIEPPEESDFSNEDDATTYDNLQAPSLFEMFAISDTEIECIFKDNSLMEDDFRIELKPDGGSWSEKATVAPNFDYAKIGSLIKGQKYYGRVRARQGPGYSGYSNEDDATTYNEPSQPTNLAITDKEDKKLRLTWTASTGEVTGYKIEKSTNGSSFSQIAVIGPQANFLVRGLSPGIQYWFKIRAYGPGGNSTYSSTVNDTTLAQYVQTEFEKLIEKPAEELIFLTEIEDQRMKVESFTIVGGKTYTYQKSIDEGGIDIEKVTENGSLYVEKNSITEVENTVSSFFFDYANQVLYVHTSTGGNPSGFTIIVWFREYFSNKENMIFNGKFYRNLISAIPDISQEIKPYFEGNVGLLVVELSLFNPEMPDGSYFFDKRHAKYYWLNSKLNLKVGAERFTYSQFKSIFRAAVDNESCSDTKLNLTMRGLRDEMGSISLNKFWKTDYRDMEDEFEGKEKFILLGRKNDVIPVRIDKTNKKFEYHDPTWRTKKVVAVTVNDVPMIENTDYFVDYRRNRITFSRSSNETQWVTSTLYHVNDLVKNNNTSYVCILEHTSSGLSEPGVGASWSTYWTLFSSMDSSVIKVSFWGIVNSANELIENGTECFIWLMKNKKGLADSDLNYDDLYEAKYANEKELSIPIWKDGESFDDIIQKIEHSIKAYSRQDGEGRIGLKSFGTTPESNAPRLRNFHFQSGYSQGKSKDSVYTKIRIYWGENQKQEWQFEDSDNDLVKWKYNLTEEKILKIYTYFDTQSYAQDLAEEIKAFLNKETVSFTVQANLFGCLAGDLIYLNRLRFFSESGTASDVKVRLQKITKSLNQKKTTITGEIVE